MNKEVANPLGRAVTFNAGEDVSYFTCKGYYVPWKGEVIYSIEYFDKNGNKKVLCRAI